MRDDDEALLRRSRDVMLDVGRAGKLLAELVDGDRVDRVDVIDAKPGQRYVLRVLLHSGRPLIGKLFAEAQRARWAWAAHDALWRAGLRVPRPVGLVAEASLVVCEEDPGTPLAQHLEWDQAGSLVAGAGRWLANMHDASPPMERQFDIETEMANLAEWARVVGATNPQVADRAQQLAARIAIEAPTRSAATAIHKDFHPGHVLVGSEMTVIDFDEARNGNPEFDVGHFIAYLHLQAWRRPPVAHRLADLERAFVDGYRSAGRTFSEPLALWAQAYTFVKIARQLALGVGVAPHPNGRARHQQIESAVRAGEVCCGAGCSS